MPFVSESQRRKFLVLLDKGLITKQQFDEWDSATDRKKLPIRINKPVSMKMKTARVIK